MTADSFQCTYSDVCDSKTCNVFCDDLNPGSSFEPGLKVKVDANRNVLFSSRNGNYDNNMKLDKGIDDNDKVIAENGPDSNKNNRTPDSKHFASCFHKVNNNNIDHFEHSMKTDNVEYDKSKTDIVANRN